MPGGAKFEGSYLNDSRSGPGTYTFANGMRFEGSGASCRARVCRDALLGTFEGGHFAHGRIVLRDDTAHPCVWVSGQMRIEKYVIYGLLHHRPSHMQH